MCQVGKLGKAVIIFEYNVSEIVVERASNKHMVVSDWLAQK